MFDPEVILFDRITSKWKGIPAKYIPVAFCEDRRGHGAASARKKTPMRRKYDYILKLVSKRPGDKELHEFEEYYARSFRGRRTIVRIVVYRLYRDLLVGVDEYNGITVIVKNLSEVEGASNLQVGDEVVLTGRAMRYSKTYAGFGFVLKQCEVEYVIDKR